MKKITTYCDVCGKEKPSELQHWTQSWGSIDIIVKLIGFQGSDRSFDDCCHKCAEVIVTKIKEAIDIIHTEHKSPLAEALK